MRFAKYFGLFLVANAASLLCWLWSSSIAVSQSTLQLQTTPPLNQVIPATEPVQLTLQAMNAQQQPLTDAKIQLRLLAPAKTPWLSSDFPIVEGTTLLDMEAIAPSGTLQFEQTLPIRGTYYLEAKVTPQRAGDFEPVEQTLSFSVPENPVKYRNVAILAAILLVAGLGSGWVLGGDQSLQDGEMAPRPVRMLLSGGCVVAIAILLVINISAELTEHHDHASTASASIPATQTSEGIQVELSGDTLAMVGQLAPQTVQVTDATTKIPLTDVAVKIQINSLEHNERVFTFEGFPDATGQLTWQPQFFDGAPHQVIATVLPGNFSRSFQPIQVAHEVDVHGVAPPLYIRFITLIYFTAIFVAALIGGLFLRRRHSSQPFHSSVV
ncbi:MULTISPECIES: hypothetical protein [unclassified Leptolyngbya]|uniref:hypothetical protein n=1 Tax=unclassified Leptolyngbya TaxID=2650499 RepID=UPI00168801C7|nr:MULTISPECIES: hypothetical protein [unclassified Leptolyngbya]MBD1911334.1 hypothetical protein [Leptolyngbya sp. FACHB-8]MBD2156648.1 hypothetical protein [Leptolyngbya sp. FACHB-16]